MIGKSYEMDRMAGECWSYTISVFKKNSSYCGTENNFFFEATEHTESIYA